MLRRYRCRHTLSVYQRLTMHAERLGCSDIRKAVITKLGRARDRDRSGIGEDQDMKKPEMIHVTITLNGTDKNPYLKLRLTQNRFEIYWPR